MWPNYTPEKGLDLEDFIKMDYRAVNHFHLPIELMMENAGYHLARLIHSIVRKDHIIRIGVGNGNNGGGGLVAARRLAAWGYKVDLDIPVEINKPLPSAQLDRAKKFGVKEAGNLDQPHWWIDAYFGFSQRIPLPDIFIQRIHYINSLDCKRVSLDIPTGILASEYFHPDIVLTMAAHKTILEKLSQDVEIYIADLGIPETVYREFEIIQPSFGDKGIVKKIW